MRLYGVCLRLMIGNEKEEKKNGQRCGVIDVYKEYYERKYIHACVKY